MPELVAAEGPILDQILDASYDIWNEGLSRAAYARYYAAQLKTRWGQRHLSRLALVDGDRVLASAKQYAFTAVLDDRPVRVLGIGAVFTQPASRGRGHALVLLQRLIDQAATEGVDLALLFSAIGGEYYARAGFDVIPTTDLELRVTESDRYGAPATLVRSGEVRDVADIVKMGRLRAAAYRFHLDRDADLVEFVITKKRLLAGLGSPGVREVRFFIAEEGASAVAYVVLSVRDREWIVEECGDRDPAGARVGAILQVLIARDPAEGRPETRAWLPPGFLPPQIRVVDGRSSSDVMMIRGLTMPTPRLGAVDVLYWRSDIF